MRTRCGRRGIRRGSDNGASVAQRNRDRDGAKGKRLGFVQGGGVAVSAGEERVPASGGGARSLVGWDRGSRGEIVADVQRLSSEQVERRRRFVVLAGEVELLGAAGASGQAEIECQRALEQPAIEATTRSRARRRSKTTSLRSRVRATPVSWECVRGRRSSAVRKAAGVAYLTRPPAERRRRGGGRERRRVGRRLRAGPRSSDRSRAPARRRARPARGRLQSRPRRGSSARRP